MKIEKKSRKEVEEYYDFHSEIQTDVKYNLRQYKIASFVKKLKSGKNVNVLEIGCGIGVLTKLLYNVLKPKFYVGTDISSKSIDYAKNLFKEYKNVDFVLTDMSDFNYDKKFDIVVFADVLEHIPEENHKEIFQTIDKLTSNSGVIVINIPTPEYNEYLEIYSPEELQVIDQKLSIGKLIINAENNGFVLDYFERYSIFRTKKDYIRIIFRRKAKIDYTKRKSLFVRIPEKFFNKILLRF